MKKRKTMTFENLVQLWRGHYMKGESISSVAKKLDLVDGSAHQAYHHLDQYLHGKRGLFARKVYIQAAKEIKRIIRDEIEMPQKEEEMAAQTLIQEQLPVEQIPVEPYARLANAMQELEKSVEGVIAYNAEKERKRITEIMEEAKFSNWSESLKRKFAGA